VRHRYVVAYDVTDPKRLKLVHKKMCGFGDWLQYSVFRCDLSDVELTLMKEAIGAIINHAEDRVMLVDIGPVDGRGAAAFEFLGVGRAPAPGEGAVIV
jgi:CRISPR-associated protein Cas2